MEPKKLKCPKCGEAVYESDDVCMSCGAHLGKGAAEPPAPQQPAAPAGPPGPAPVPGTTGPLPRPTPREKPPIARPITYRIVERMGDAWDYYAWVGLAVSTGIAWFGLHGVPQPLASIFLAIEALWFMTFLLWVIIDVVSIGLGWWWILISTFCYPIGFVVYLLWGRQS